MTYKMCGDDLYVYLYGEFDDSVAKTIRENIDMLIKIKEDLQAKKKPPEISLSSYRKYMREYPVLKETYGEIINVGNTAPITIRNLAERVVSLLDSKSEIECVPYDKAYEPGFEDMIQRVPDCSKIASLCGWRAEIPLDDIILDVAAYLRAE